MMNCEIERFLMSLFIPIYFSKSSLNLPQKLTFILHECLTEVTVLCIYQHSAVTLQINRPTVYQLMLLVSLSLPIYTVQ